MKINLHFYFILISTFVQINAQNIIQAEILGRPTNNSITVQAFFDASVEVCIQYGTISENYQAQTAWQTFAANEAAEIIVSNLQSDTKYFYRMCYRQANTVNFTTRPEHTFHTQRAAGETFTFVVQADPHMDEQSSIPVYERCLQNQLEDNPDFMIDLGDFLMTDKLKNLTTNKIPKDTIAYRCKLLRSKYEISAHSVPLFIALGNHEGESGWNLNETSENIAVWGTNERKKYFLNPAPDNFYTGDATNYTFVGQRESYYSWTWGDALFIVIDPYWFTNLKPGATTGWRWTLGQVQYNWLRTTLENSTAKFKFVFSHQIVGGDPNGRGGVEFADLYEWGGKNPDTNKTDGFATNRTGWYKPIKDLLAENKVTIFFHGHDHFFGKQEKDCLVYQETPQPSHSNTTTSSVSYATSYGYLEGTIIPNTGHIRVTVSSNGVQTEYVRTYLPASETTTRHNKDVSSSYFIGTNNCYLGTNYPILWNSNYDNEIVYPNPFSKDTAIEFSINQPQRLYLTIYDEIGQIVRKLIDGNLINQGKLQIIWDGKDSSGTDLTNGIYLYSIKGELGEVKSGKIILKR